MKDGITLEQVQGVKKHTDSANLLGEITRPVEQTTSMENNNQEYHMAIAKGEIELGDLVSTKESKPSIHIKVLGCCMFYAVKNQSYLIHTNNWHSKY